MGGDQAALYVASLFKPGFADVPAFFLDDALRTNMRAAVSAPWRRSPSCTFPGAYLENFLYFSRCGITLSMPCQGNRI